ncbi:MAG: protein TolQ [Legionellales bacterium RIFCSPHIGHO2_12_FULL_42_9]|nr:MAG: protein TolQ [Legionellales bacterium RIFCSPHIGHO2_12_FULL_42_9]
MTGEVNIVGYFLQASMVVKMVMLILLAASASTWLLMFKRAIFFREQKKQCDEFEQRFWGTKDLSNLYRVIDTEPEEQKGMASIFHTAYERYARFSKRGIPVSLESIERAMQIHQEKEAVKLEKGLPLFASVGSIAPYVGLFGTVLGIMPTLQALGHAQQATIALVAPGLSEALVATALGLFTAIPSVMAYNRFSMRANELLERYQLFQDEVLGMIDNETQDITRG